MSKKNYLKREDIQRVIDRAYEEVDVPEWGGTVRVRSLTGKEKDAFERSLIIVEQHGKKTVAVPDLENMRAKLAVLSMVDEDGNMIFSNDDIPWLTEKSASALDRVVKVAQYLSRMNDVDFEEIKELLKNDRPAASHTD